MIVWIPDDTGARSVGSDALVAAVRAAVPGAEVVRNGSRGLYALEPLVEVGHAGERLAFANVAPADVPAILADPAAPHPRALGPVGRIPALARQQRVLFRRAGNGDPLDLPAYRADGGFAALEQANATAPDALVAAVERSGLRGRGGAGFPAGRKWRTVASQPGPRRVLVCNADEGDSGTFADRLLLEADPYRLLEGMLVAARAVDARDGYVYVRSEYPLAIERVRAAIDRVVAAGLAGAFRFHLRRGAGAYICGEESALLESLEGRRGVARARPPLPAVRGLDGLPTLVHNVLTFAAVPDIVLDGGAAHAATGVAPSCGTQPFQLGGNVRHGGLYELPFGVPLRTLVEDFGGGTRSGRPVGGVQVGGPLGAWLGPGELDVPMTWEALAARGAMLGHGGVVVFDDTIDWRAQAEFAFEFCAAESCGKCTPCRIGAVRGRELLRVIRTDGIDDARRVLLTDLCTVMRDASLCAMGGLTPQPVLSALRLAGDLPAVPGGTAP